MAEREIRSLATTHSAARFVSQSLEKARLIIAAGNKLGTRSKPARGSAVLAFELALRVYVTLFAMVGRREQVAGKQNRPCFFEDHCNFTARTHDDRKALERFDRIVCGGWHVLPPLVLSSPYPISDAHQKRIAIMSAPQQMFDTEHMMEVGESKNNRLIPHVDKGACGALAHISINRDSGGLHVSSPEQLLLGQVSSKLLWRARSRLSAYF